MLGIDVTRKVLADLGDIAVQVAAASKGGIHFWDYKKFYDMIKPAKDILAQGKDVVPELKDLDANEAKILVGDVLGIIEKVIAARA